jgi:hypothetical protein
MQSVDEKLSRAGYAPEEFGALFGKSRWWVYAQLKADRLKSVSVGHSRIIPASEVDRLLNEAS